MNVSPTLLNLFDQLVDKYPDLAREVCQAPRTKVGFDYLDLAVEIPDDGKKLPVIRFAVTPLSAVQAGQGWTGVNRTAISAGRILNRVFPGKESYVRGVIEALKAAVSFTQSEFTTTILRGADIHRAYNEGRQVAGELSSSCMSGANPAWLELYTDNPERIQLIKVMRGTGYVARALIWTDIEILNSEQVPLCEGPTVVPYLDRQYCRTEAARAFLRDWALNQGYLIWTSKTTWSRRINGVTRTFTVNAPLKLRTPVFPRWRYNRAPYLDTFQMLDKSEGRLYSSLSASSFRQFTKADGSFYDSDGDYVKYCPPGYVLTNDEEAIPEEEALRDGAIWYRRSRCRICDICGTLRGITIARSVEDRNKTIGANECWPVVILCTDCSQEIIYSDKPTRTITRNGQTARLCGGCDGQFVLNGDRCYRCVPRSMWCVTCSSVNRENAKMTLLDGQYQCPSCVNLHTDFCFTCARRTRRSKLSTLNECTDCQSTRENSTVLWISNNSN